MPVARFLRIVLVIGVAGLTAAIFAAPPDRPAHAQRATATPTAVARPTRTPRPVVRPQAAITTRADLRVDGMGYQWWGRPLAMDKAGASCGEFDDLSRTLKLEASFLIENRSTQALTASDYRVQFYKTDDTQALTCFYLYRGASEAPTIKPGESVSITYMGYVEPHERVAYAQLITRPFGRANRIVVPATLKLPG